MELDIQRLYIHQLHRLFSHYARSVENGLGSLHYRIGYKWQASLLTR